MRFQKITLAATGLIAAVSAGLTSAASAQASPQSDYDRGYQAGRADAARANQGYDQAPPSNQGDYSQQGEDADNGPPPAPESYDGSTPPPPPPGYDATDETYAPNPDADRRYEAYAEDWAQRYCVKSTGNAAGGAVIGGLFGALLGSSVAGRHDRGAGALMGGIAGAAVGGAAGSAQDNATSPGCPPGYVVRRDAPTFAYDGYDAGYYYAAPAWYHPWIFVEGRWNYRPYPYHAYYYGHWGRPGYYRWGYRGGYRRHW